jgi:hypothetical protein
MGFLRSFAWQIGCGAAVALAIVLGWHLIQAKLEVRRLSTSVAVLTDRIENPKTGYIVQLARAQSNIATLKSGIQDQNDKFAAWQAEGERQMAATERALKAARSEVARLQARSDGTLRYVPKGDDVCERIEDIRRHYLEGLQ